MVMAIEVTPYSSVHMMWLLPQYFVITAGEVMFSVTGLQFSFTQVNYYPISTSYIFTINKYIHTHHCYAIAGA